MKIKKEKLDNFIKKYNLRKENESVKFTLSKENGTLSVRVKASNNSMIGEIQMNGLTVEESVDFGIYDTFKFKKLSDILSDEIDMSLVKSTNGVEVCAISMSDGTTDVNCMSSKISVLPKVPTLKKFPDPTFAIKIDRAMMESFKAAVSGLFSAKDTIQNFTFVPKGDEVVMVINHSADSNSNKVKLKLNTVNGMDKLSKEISFSAELLNEILIANSDFFVDDKTVVEFKVSEVGIATIAFDTVDFNCKYYLTELVNK